MPNKTHGSPYKMKAGKMGPMQKNFGPELAINKKLDKDSMAGGLTGQPGKTLDGPLAKKSPIYKKKGGIKPTVATNKAATTRKKGVKRDSMLSDTNKDGNMISRGFAKAKANRTAKSNMKKANKMSKSKDVLTKNILNTKQPGDEAVRPKVSTVANKKSTPKETFGNAFKSARKKHGGDGGTFSYKGKKYSTNTKKKK